MVLFSLYLYIFYNSAYISSCSTQECHRSFHRVPSFLCPQHTLSTGPKPASSHGWWHSYFKDHSYFILKKPESAQSRKCKVICIHCLNICVLVRWCSRMNKMLWTGRGQKYAVRKPSSSCVSMLFYVFLLINWYPLESQCFLQMEMALFIMNGLCLALINCSSIFGTVLASLLISGIVLGMSYTAEVL